MGSSKWFKIAAVIFLLCITSNTCLANPVPLFSFNPINYVTMAVVFDIIIDFIVLAVAFTVLGMSSNLGTKNFKHFFVLVVFGGLLIDFLGIFPSVSPLSYGAIVFVMLTAYNFSLTCAFFRANAIKALTIGILMGILTNPALWHPLVEDFAQDKKPYHMQPLEGDGYSDIKPSVNEVDEV